jgi:hypothetical protein
MPAPRRHVRPDTDSRCGQLATDPGRESLSIRRPDRGGISTSAPGIRGATASRCDGRWPPLTPATAEQLGWLSGRQLSLAGGRMRGRMHPPTTPTTAANPHRYTLCSKGLAIGHRSTERGFRGLWVRPPRGPQTGSSAGPIAICSTGRKAPMWQRCAGPSSDIATLTKWKPTNRQDTTFRAPDPESDVAASCTSKSPSNAEATDPATAGPPMSTSCVIGIRSCRSWSAIIRALSPPWSRIVATVLR